MTIEPVRVERLLPVRPETVFDAWTNPESLRQWMSPGSAVVGSVECDPRVGGSFRIVMLDGHGALEHAGRYLELERPRRLVFTWRSPVTGSVDTRVTVEFAGIDAGTLMVITHEGLDEQPTRDAHRGGWASIADKLAEAVTTTG